MTARIIERGRGPEIEGTRITVYNIMDYTGEMFTPERIGEILDLSVEQVRAARTYIEAHREELEPVYQQMLERERRGNPPWVDALLAGSVEELKRRLALRKAGASADHASPG